MDILKTKFLCRTFDTELELKSLESLYYTPISNFLCCVFINHDKKT